MSKPLIYVGMMLLSIGLLLGCSSENAANRKPVKQEPAPIESRADARAEFAEGDFIYRLVSEKSEFSTRDKINIYAELEYIGMKEEISIFHAASPFYFPMYEKTREYHIDYMMDQPGITTTLKRGQPLRGTFTGGGGYSEKDSKDYVEFIKSLRDLKFPKGEYEVSGSAQFNVIVNEETQEKYDMRASIVFQVK